MAKKNNSFLLIIFKVFKFLISAKPLLALISFGGYALLYNWKFALVLMGSLAFHESGHVYAMKKMGIKTKGFYFLPFVGGAAIAEERYKTYSQQAYIALMGPIWGGALALAALGTYFITGLAWIGAVAGWMAILNLFNLLPVLPLDGGQVFKTIGHSLNEVKGFVITSIVTVIGTYLLYHYTHMLLFVIFGIINFLEIYLTMAQYYFAWFPYHRNSDYPLKDLKLSDPQYYDAKYGDKYSMSIAMNKKHILYTAGTYVLTIIVLLMISAYTKHIPGLDIAQNLLK